MASIFADFGVKVLLVETAPVIVPSADASVSYGSVGLTKAEASSAHDVAVGVACYDDLLRPVADGRPDGFCQLIADRQSHHILGAGQGHYVVAV